MLAAVVAVGLVACCLVSHVNGAPAGKIRSLSLQEFSEFQQDLSTANFIYTTTGQFGDLELCGCWTIASTPTPEKADMAKKYPDPIKASINQEVSVNTLYGLDEYGNLLKCRCYSTDLPE